ncbi:hypothetical protein WSK_0278 [Novosphingobium sp. Rr 2-17]|uniref:hypothetical protein n=1 Tax=Novosphingobium sp. Rr 2-17 TaxID=555793 RepID=UPI0002698B3A|nr:hypothetical protein [Novosphingobium sp. Rr 2-17]EIZ81126.1 hypothetical protein WSK_0278 [Novosphingobium sp. Rr 2-17]
MTETNPFSGMTINERLYSAAREEAFDIAIKANDRATMIRILNEVGVEDAAWSADGILKDSSRYGY